MMAVFVCWLYGCLTFSLSLLTVEGRESEGDRELGTGEYECSSGVMRAWHVAQSIPDVCSMCAGDS